MHEFELIKKYFSKLSKKNKSALNQNDDVFFDKKKELVISIDTYNDKIHFIDFNKPDLVIKKKKHRSFGIRCFSPRTQKRRTVETRATRSACRPSLWIYTVSNLVKIKK